MTVQAGKERIGIKRLRKTGSEQVCLPRSPEQSLPGRHGNDRRIVDVIVAQLLGDLDACHSGQHEIEQDQGRMAFADDGHDLPPIGETDRLVVLEVEQRADGVQQSQIVIDHDE